MWFYYFIISGHESCRNCPKDLYAFGYTFSHHQGLFHFYKILTEYMDLIAYMSRDRVFVKENLTITGDTNIMRHNFSLFFYKPILINFTLCTYTYMKNISFEFRYTTNKEIKILIIYFVILSAGIMR